MEIAKKNIIYENNKTYQSTRAKWTSCTDVFNVSHWMFIKQHQQPRLPKLPMKAVYIHVHTAYGSL